MVSAGRGTRWSRTRPWCTWRCGVFVVRQVRVGLSPSRVVPASHRHGVSSVSRAAKAFADVILGLHDQPVAGADGPARGPTRGSPWQRRTCLLAPGRWPDGQVGPKRLAFRPGKLLNRREGYFLLGVGRPRGVSVDTANRLLQLRSRNLPDFGAHEWVGPPSGLAARRTAWRWTRACRLSPDRGDDVHGRPTSG